MATLSFVLLAVAFTTSSAINLPMLHLPGSGKCDNAISSEMVSMFSPDSSFSKVVVGAINFVNSSIVCKSEPDSKVNHLRSTIKMVLFYGPTNTDYQAETLDNITNLLNGGHLNFSRPTTCFFPGWIKGPRSENYSTTFVDAYLANDTTNILVLDWSEINHMEYTRVVSVMPNVARWLSVAFDALSKASEGRVTSMVFVGHSLGAHLCGYIARRLTVLNIPFLTALDPAGPLFSAMEWPCQQGVLPTDAKYVMTIHSDGGRFGRYEPTGNVDYYANGGTFLQPGCTAFDSNPKQCASQFLCSHQRALYLWCEAVRRPGSVFGRHCTSASAFASNMCSEGATNDITHPTSTLGQYFFNTLASYPYGQGMKGV